jgi:uncharacterized membrane protein YcaP (DUF421 family)
MSAMKVRMNTLEQLVVLSIVRTLVSYIILMVATYWLGKHVNAHKNYYNFALSISIGSFIANMAFDVDLKFFPMLSAFLTLMVIYFIMAIVSAKSRHFRKWLSGHPIVIIENGMLLDVNMKKVKYSIDYLNQQLREQGIFDIFEVEYALLEASGNISVLRKTQYQHVNKKDLNLGDPEQKNDLPVELIMDGTIIEKNFNGYYSKQWLDKELKIKNLQINEIQYAVIGTNGSLFIDLYKDQLTSPADME